MVQFHPVGYTTISYLNIGYYYLVVLIVVQSSLACLKQSVKKSLV